MRSLLCLLLACVATSCSMPIKGVCTEGPNKGQRITAKASWNALGTGKITAVAPWGEKAEGRYQTNMSHTSTLAWSADATSTGNSVHASGDDVLVGAGGHTQVGTALLLGDQGSSFDVVYWTSGLSPLHGQGRVRDTRGNKYRLVW